MNHFQNNFRDFLSNCLIKNEQARWSAEKLLRHSFIQAPIKPRVQPKHKPLDMEVDDAEDHSNKMHPELPVPCDKSRLNKDFKMIKWIGRGAFGAVFKVRHKVDKMYYAIKQIEIGTKMSAENKKIRREMKLLSRLTHDNVVRYHNSWTEVGIVPISPSTEDEMEVIIEF